MNFDRTIQIIDNEIAIIDQKQENVTLIPGDNCHLTVNGKTVTSPVRISQGDQVTWRVKEQPASPYELTVSPDRLHVHLTVFTNCHETSEAILKSEQKGWRVDCISRPDPNLPITVADVIHRYGEQQLRAPIDHAKVEQALRNQSQSPVLIAEGEAVIEGKNGWVDTHFPLDEEVPFEQSGDKLNYREKRRIPIVRPGEQMATIQPPTAGKPGTDVYGHPIPPEPTRPVNCRFKENVREENGVVHANITGRPTITAGRNPVLDVVPVYTIAGNVDLTTGHVRFNGDILIYGNVMEKMEVTAGQSIVVYGSVYGATLTAGGAIQIEHTIRQSRVFAGQRGTLAKRVQQPLAQLYDRALSAEKSRRRLEEEATKKQRVISSERIIQHLLTHFYPDILTLTKNILQSFDNHPGYLPEDLTPLQRLLRQLLNESEQRYQLNTWLEIKKELALCMADTLDVCAQPESVITQTADVSYLEVHGDVVFTGKGSTQSHIVASDRILYTESGAACRGGTLDAGRQIVAQRLGSLSGSKTHCRAGNRISARVFQHCDIQLAGHTRYVEEATQMEYYREGDHTLFRHLI